MISMDLLTARIVQRGRTLIELLIAMAIGLVIVVGVSSLYLSSSGMSRTANQISTAEQAAQLALLMIGDSLKLAAYGEIIGSDFAAQGQTLMDGVHLRGCSDGRFVDPFPPYLDTPTPGTPPPPDLTCTAGPVGDALYIRYQAAPSGFLQQLEANDVTRNSLLDCGAYNANQRQILSSVQMRAGVGLERRVVTNVFQFDPVAGTLDCSGYNGAGFAPLINNVVEFKVFYRFDDVAHAAGASGVTNAVPFGGSIRDAAYVNGLAGAVDPWNYVVAVMVCVTLKTDQGGVSTAPTNPSASRCPVTSAEAENVAVLTKTVTDGSIHRTFSQVFTVRARATPTPSIL